jgi:hypothetical protein
MLLTFRLPGNNIASSLGWLISNSNVEKGPGLAHQLPFPLLYKRTAFSRHCSIYQCRFAIAHGLGFDPLDAIS